MPTRKHLKQSTLFNYNTRASTSTRTKTQLHDVASPKRKRVKELDAPDHTSASDSDDVHAIKFQSKAPTTRNTHPAVKRRKNLYVIDSESGENASTLSEEDSDTGQVPARKGKRQQIRSDSSDSDSPIPAAASTVVNARTPQQECSDDEELGEEVDKDFILPTRLRARGKMTAFQKGLEKLKRRKQRQRAGSTSQSNGSREESDVSESDVKPIKGAKPHDDYTSLFGDGTDEDSDSSSNFIVEDDGVTPQPLPAEFSMESHQDLSHQFKRVFQLFVHIAIRPPADRHQFMLNQMRDEEYFTIPLKIIRRKLLGLRDSLVASSAWRPEFKRSLERYPKFDLTQLDYAMPGCDACHLGSRRSTLIGRLSGVPYDKHGFGKIPDESDSDDDSASDEPDNFEYNLGRFCGKRTRVYHELTHWEYALFENILQEVDDLHAAKQSKGFIRIAYAGRKRPPDDLGDADGICEWLDERKIIDMEWQRIKDVTESARHLEMVAGKDGD
ncbi:hypothetical protein AX15_003962 [Amanita polypyramis BW_CC]|nr:hypothetical protein AX15_003962 [Amanita polypyramis BW_CC]